MKIDTFKKCDKLKTKEEMLEELRKYKSILSKPMNEYFEGLIELDYSVIKDLLSENDRELLSNLNLYKDVFIYNVYNRTLNLFKFYVSDYDIKYIGKDNGIDGLSFKVDGNNIFDFDYSYSDNNEIGKIFLFKYALDDNQLKESIDKMTEILERLRNEKNPFGEPHRGIIGSPSSQWSIDHQSKISKYESLLEKINILGELTDDQKRKIDVTQKFQDLLLEDFGISLSEFKEVNDCSTSLNKKLIKVMPGITILDNISYYIK